jgi:isopentenyl-diphosphate delta-isomerase type 1
MADEGEVLPVVDEHDNVVDEAPREEVHAEGLRHRAVQVHVYDREGRLYLHKRASSKVFHPDVWTASATGHVEAGESYREAAARELDEELGLEGRLRKELKFLYEDEQDGHVEREFTSLLTVLVDEAPEPDPDEIQEGKWMFPEDVDAWVQEEPGAFAPSFREAFERYLWKC